MNCRTQKFDNLGLLDSLDSPLNKYIRIQAMETLEHNTFVQEGFTVSRQNRFIFYI